MTYPVEAERRGVGRVTKRIIPIHDNTPMPQAFMGGGESIFSQQAIDRSIARAGQQIGEGRSGLVAHLDSEGELSFTVVQRIGDHLEAQAGVLADTSKGFHFTKENLAFEASIVARW